MILKRRDPALAGNAQQTVSEFERVVARLRLRPDQYVASQELRAWAEANKDARFIPESLLKAWGIPLRRNIEDFI